MVFGDHLHPARFDRADRRRRRPLRFGRRPLHRRGYLHTRRDLAADRRHIRPEHRHHHRPVRRHVQAPAGRDRRLAGRVARGIPHVDPVSDRQVRPNQIFPVRLAGLGIRGGRGRSWSCSCGCSYSAQILFFGAEFTQVYANQYGSHVVPAGNAEPLTEDMRRQAGIGPCGRLDQPPRPPGPLQVHGQVDAAGEAGSPSPSRCPVSRPHVRCGTPPGSPRVAASTPAMRTRGAVGHGRCTNRRRRRPRPVRLPAVQGHAGPHGRHPSAVAHGGRAGGRSWPSCSGRSRPTGTR